MWMQHVPAALGHHDGHAFSTLERVDVDATWRLQVAHDYSYRSFSTLERVDVDATQSYPLNMLSASTFSTLERVDVDATLA